MTTTKNKFIGIRLASMLVDHLIMSVGIGIFGGILVGIGYLIAGNSEETQLSNWIIFILVTVGFLLLSIYFNKDAIRGKGPAKRILGLIVLNNKTNKVATPLRCLVRNVTLIIWPIEVFFCFFSPKRRIGDFIAGTKVIEDNSSFKTAIKLKVIVASLLIGGLSLFLIFSLYYY